MIVALLKTKLREDAPVDAYNALGARMYELVSASPGFISAEFFENSEGKQLTIARFESEEALATWRTLPEHVEAQKRGMSEFYQPVVVQVCELRREYERQAG